MRLEGIAMRKENESLRLELRESIDIRPAVRKSVKTCLAVFLCRRFQDVFTAP